MIKNLKGDTFVNRYRFTGTLKTCSPLHVGSGKSSSSDNQKQTDNSTQAKEKKGEVKKTPEVSTIIKDFKGRPLIPGSTLRGVMRSWLFGILQAGFGDEWAHIRSYTTPALTSLSQAEQINKIKNEFSWLELLFGTPFHEGKIEVWDASCITAKLTAPDTLLGWKDSSLTYIDTSVAINPATGTAIEDLLYNAEVVPPGVEFEFNLVGQNLSDFEIGLVLLALQGFNSSIYPILVGARTGRGYGRMKFVPGRISGLKADGLQDWVANTVQSFGTDNPAEVLGNAGDAAGYYALPLLSEAEQKRLIAAAKKQLTTKAEG